MCASCGCSTSHTEHHPHDSSGRATVLIEQDILHANNHVAQHNRAWFARQGILTLNLVSSPGSGKTALLEQTIRSRTGDFFVIEGDQAGNLDADRIRAVGGQVLQLNTGTSCHLDAPMIRQAVADLNPAPGSVLFIENVGNLVCPALFDLGEHAKILVASVTEGEDKPLKYPHMFRAAELVVLNKIDLLPYVSFDPERFAHFVRQVHPHLEILHLSATRGDGLTAWMDWIEQRRAALCPASDLVPHEVS